MGDAVADSGARTDSARQLSWKRVVLALVVTAVVVPAVAGLISVGAFTWRRHVNISDSPAYAGLGLPLKRRVVFTNEGHGPWAAWCGQDGLISVRQNVRDSWERSRYEQTLVHEHGHALLEDVFAGGRAFAPIALRRYQYVSAMQRFDEVPDWFPDSLQPMLTVYRRIDPHAYASSDTRGPMALHLTESFGEFFAESFARWRVGDEVEPLVAGALTEITLQADRTSASSRQGKR